jgi:hypothetical protein
LNSNCTRRRHRDQPVLPSRYEDRIAEDRAGGTVRIDYLIRIGLGDVKKINYYRQAIRDPEAAVKNATLRPFVGEVLEQTLDLIFSDSQLFNRFRTLLQKQDKTRGENELPEDEDERFRKWREQSQYARARFREGTSKSANLNLTFGSV